MNKTITIPISEMIPAGSTLTLTFSKEGSASMFPIGVTNPQVSITNTTVNSSDDNFTLSEAMSKVQNLPFKEDSVLQNILNDGYVKNTKFHRRWVMAQYLKAMQSPGEYNGYINSMRFKDAFDKFIEEVRVLSKLEESNDIEAFNERKTFLSLDTIQKIVKDYEYEVARYIKGLPRKKCKGKLYVNIKGVGSVYVTDLEEKVFNPLNIYVNHFALQTNYRRAYALLKGIKSLRIQLPDYTHKSKHWKNAYQSSGAYYTLKNMIMYHNCALPVYEKNGLQYRGLEAVQELKELLGNYQGFQYHALLKETIRVNDFDYVKRMKEIGVCK